MDKSGQCNICSAVMTINKTLMACDDAVFKNDDWKDNVWLYPTAISFILSCSTAWLNSPNMRLLKMATMTRMIPLSLWIVNKWWDFFALLVKYLPFFTSTTTDWNFFAPQLFPNWTYCHYHLWNCYILVKGPGKKNVFFQAWRKRQTILLNKPGSNSRSTDFEFWFPSDYKIFPPGSNSSVMAHNVSSISTNGSAHTIFLHRVKNIRWVGLF